MEDQAVIDRTRRWIATMVIGLNLCPFARRVFEADAIRFVVSDAKDETALLADLTKEMKALASMPIKLVETTLLIHPHALGDFLDYNDFLALADRRVAALGLEGVIQIASFHPLYRFAESEANAVEDYTNRSPYPMLHLLREDSISAVANDSEELLEIPRRNIETLRKLGLRKVIEMNES
jgi:uncharacterized protein